MEHYILFESQPQEPAGESTPFLVEFFLVQGIGYTCMAYRDRDGKWRRAVDSLELPGPIAVLE